VIGSGWAGQIGVITPNIYKMGKIILITGASRGIGLALAQLFAAQGHRVIGTSRLGQVPVWQHPNFEALPLDLADAQSIGSFPQRLAPYANAIDILVNNAGIGPDLGQALPEAYSFSETFAVNVQGTVFFTEAMLPSLAPGAKIVNISSKMGSIALCAESNAVAYRMSKAALNMYTLALANRLAGMHKVAALHPGSVRTTIGGNQINRGRLSPEQSAAGIAAFCCSDFEQGVFWDVETNSVLKY
jgi:NAD(P)-dependent dehydrogenase (short-subunit alcohol dehydrogenase family)